MKTAPKPDPLPLARLASPAEKGAPTRQEAFPAFARWARESGSPPAALAPPLRPLTKPLALEPSIKSGREEWGNPFPHLKAFERTTVSRPGAFGVAIAILFRRRRWAAVPDGGRRADRGHFFQSARHRARAANSALIPIGAFGGLALERALRRHPVQAIFAHERRQRDSVELPQVLRRERA
jgi:hypothetical protein